MARPAIQRILICLLLSSASSAARSFAADAPPDIPFTPPVTDSLGNRWTIGPFSIGQTGNMPLYREVGDLWIDSSRPNFTANQARVEAGNEIVFDSMTASGYSFIRRAKVSDDGSTIRVIDVVTYTDSTRHGIWYGTHMQMPARNVEALPPESGLIGYIVEDVQGRATIEIWGQAGAALALNIDPHADNNGFIVGKTNFPLPIPVGTPAVVVHIHASAANITAARALAATFDSKKILASLPADLRDRAANFAPLIRFSAVPELLHGDTQDILELRSGQQLRGTLQEKSVSIHGVLGTVEVPMSDVEGVVTRKDSDWDRTLLTRGGDVLRGRLGSASVHFRQSDGTVLEIPAGEINRIGMRADAQPATTQPENTSWFSTLGGDRIAIEPPAAPIEIHTACGTLKLDPARMAEISFGTASRTDHRVVLTDGSRFSGILAASSLELQPKQLGPKLTVPVSAMAVLQLQTPADPDALKPAVKLLGGDLLVGALIGDIALETSFNTVTIHTAELASLSPLPDSPASVAAVLSDGIRVRGRLASADVGCTTSAGVSLRVPLLLLADYTQPRPALTQAMLDNIRLLIPQLAADDWKVRERTQAQLIAMGPVIIDALRKLRSDQTPEGQQRIDTILSSLETQQKP